MPAKQQAVNVKINDSNCKKPESESQLSLLLTQLDSLLEYHDLTNKNMINVLQPVFLRTNTECCTQNSDKKVRDGLTNLNQILINIIDKYELTLHNQQDILNSISLY
jgi:hypothetical protein